MVVATRWCVQEIKGNKYSTQREKTSKLDLNSRGFLGFCNHTFWAITHGPRSVTFLCYHVLHNRFFRGPPENCSVILRFNTTNRFEENGSQNGCRSILVVPILPKTP